ncbi:MAG TPA: hypothetical protein VHC22_00435 [Pirellulales bacterium]|nr:hypothetical protein [Pirellulales bacterium]
MTLFLTSGPRRAGRSCEARRHSIPFQASLATCIIGAFVAAGRAAADDDGRPAKKSVPPDHEVLTNTRGGAYVINKQLKKKYDDLLARAGRLKRDVAESRVASGDALQQLRDLQAQLDELRTEIEQKKQFVSPLVVQVQSEEMSFDLGPERMLVITADQVRLVGWNGQQVKCVLEKSVLSKTDEAQAAEFAAMRVHHGQGVAPNLVGATDAERDADEEKFLASEQGRQLSEAALANRRELLASIRGSFAPFRAFQGKQIDWLGIEGLQEGNDSVTVEIESPGGARTVGSDWRRHATLTVYVPRCNGILLRGCLVGLDVENIKAPLTLTDNDSHDRDYDGRFQIKRVVGPVSIFNVPVGLIEEVHGNVKVMQTVEYANSGTQHGEGQVVSYSPPPRECRIKRIEGDLHAWFARADVKLSGVTGQIDVKNEFGDTTLELNGKLSAAAHRIVSESGTIELRQPAAQREPLPLLALTNHGTVRRDASIRDLEETHFTTGEVLDGSRRDWRGFRTQKNGQRLGPADMFAAFQRPAAALAGTERSPGLDLVSRNGAILLTRHPGPNKE